MIEGVPGGFEGVLVVTGALSRVLEEVLLVIIRFQEFVQDVRRSLRTFQASLFEL